MTDAPSLGAFVQSEARAYLRTFAQTAVVATGALTALWGAFVVYVVATADRPDQAAVDLFGLAIGTVVYVATSLPFTLAVGAVLGAARVLWRGAGAASFVPFVAVPLGAFGALWLFAPVLVADLKDLAAALVGAYQAMDVPMSAHATEAVGRLAHAGPPGAAIALALIAPFLLLDLVVVLLLPPVLWALFVLLATTAAITLGGALLLGAPALLVALAAFVVRTRRRWRAAGARP